ncbi:stage II sporulation protein D [Halalkalibacterium halodurans]|uniref:stage II sporulation protein D n=1 Tax=Halalkalibacterium halodurans TaxID=86665 RepID=UPI0009FA5B6F|nr:stage II sporulation protein D [Halalkalibacterium halodurans]MDY7224254.1 stage II sporulation protein D [Halalkalibacterium halodurans]MDY7243539.1 stage II sporulation protein D [Halalkalibacterium halodurans]MED3647228.1 stage II sporulation protein D [Halalkalibacterium halodurans]MED4164863.1 stage II sporulation protein D [Halalkalibacterium halodurans]
MKRLIVIGIVLCSVILLLPALLVMFSSQPQMVTEETQMAPIEAVDLPESELAVHVFRSQTESVESVPLEEYVVGVVASEMPAEFELEALKAQSLTARTFLLKQLLEPNDIELPEGAMITDTEMHQVYQSEAELKERWGKDYHWKIARIKQAVSETAGQVLTYDGTPITAAFFSTSNGYTENSEDYWKSEIPYLRSVESPWDQQHSPRFIGEKVLSVEEFQERLGVTLPDDGSIGSIVARTEGGRVAKVNINGTEISGRVVREELELNSADFQWKRQGDNIVIETKGWGHGVGMSQYGANGMALNGSTYQEIISHYYQGVEIESVGPYEQQLMARGD